MCACMFTFGSVLESGVRMGSPIFQEKVGLPPTKSKKKKKKEMRLTAS